MALINGTKAHPVAATVGTIGGIIAMPFVTAGVAVTGAVGTVAATIPTLGLGTVPAALTTVGATVASVFVSPVCTGEKIYNALVPYEDRWEGPSTTIEDHILKAIDTIGFEL